MCGLYLYALAQTVLEKQIVFIEKILEQSVSSIPENAMDYYGADGLLSCGKCHTPKEAFFAKGLVLIGKNKHPVECACHKAEREQQEAAVKEQKHLDLVRQLKAEGFSDPALLEWTFANDNGRSLQMRHTHRYVEQWQTIHAENIGLLLWGGFGTGKSFLAGCIANALMEQKVPVCMTNFAHVVNELNSSFSGQNKVVDRLCRYPLLIIDDFGMERGTEYALEQIYNIVDSRYRSRKPLIVTTNLTLDEIRHEGIHQCLPLLWLGHIQLAEAKQPKPDELLFHLRLGQPFLCNAGLQFFSLIFQSFQPLLCGAGQSAHLDGIQHIGDAVLLGICRTFTNLALNRFFALVVAGIASVDHGGHGKHLSFYIIERWSVLSKHCFV